MFLYVVMAFWAGDRSGVQHAAVVDDGTAIAPTGALMTFLALWTGALWGRPTWGAYWVWDARLTSELILLFLYLGFMALQAAIDDPRRADKAGAVLALVGVINVPIIYFSVKWWNTLHQGASVSLKRRRPWPRRCCRDADHGARGLDVRYRGVLMRVRASDPRARSATPTGCGALAREGEAR